MPAGTYSKFESNVAIVRQGLQNLAAELPTIGRLQLYRVALSIFKRAGIYPPEYPGQRYKRTYTLRKSRTLEKTDKGYVVYINPIDRRGRPYGVYVLGSPAGGGQSAYHRSKWVPIAIITEEELAKLPEAVLQHIKIVADREAAATRGK